MRSGYWQDLTTEDLRGLDAEATVAVLPVAAVEQHGPHLPLGTDALICEGVVRRMLDLLPDTATALVLPVQAIGHSPEHARFPGTLDLSAETLLRAWGEIGAAVAAAGVRKLLIVNSHGGQPQIVDLVALRLRAAHGMLVVKVNTLALPVPPGLFAAEVLQRDVHGGAVETAMMLYLRPDLVRLDRRRDFPSAPTVLRGAEALWAPDGSAAFAWLAEDLNATGAAGNALDADAERGRALVEAAAEALVSVIGAMRAVPLSGLASGT